MQIDLGGDWGPYRRLLPKDCAVLGVVTICGHVQCALVRVASTGALIKDIGGEVLMHSQNWVWVELELLERQQQCQALEIVEVED